jgi:RHS repeat-associated protein
MRMLLSLGQVVDYYPYGKVLREFVNGASERYLTTGHERDQETGLDYRGARYYDSDVARFLSLDPKARNLPGWSTYNYVIGNPISVIDPDGKWPFWIHKRIIYEALGDLLTEGQLEAFNEASLYVDGKNNKDGQNPDNSYQHSMSEPGESTSEAREKADAFMAEKQQAYATNGDIFTLGEGAHTLADRFSPSHSGEQRWDGVKLFQPKTWAPAVVHILREMNFFKVDEYRVQQSVRAVRQYYLDAQEQRAQELEEQKLEDPTPNYNSSEDGIKKW